MNDAVLQVLLILAYLAIGLISVTFPIYAISVNFLPQQKWESEKEREKRKKELQAKITQLTSELGRQPKETEQVARIKDELDKYETELMGAQLKYQYLTAKGAVLMPMSALLPALFFSAVGIYAFYKDLREWAIGLGAFSAFLSTIALYRLCKTISAVEYGALRPERTVEFSAFFDEGDSTKTAKLEKPTNLRVAVSPKDADVEGLMMFVTVPRELTAAAGKWITTATDFWVSEHSEYILIIRWVEYAPRESALSVSFPAFPRKLGKNHIGIRVCAKKVYEYRTELVVNVVP